MADQPAPQEFGKRRPVAEPPASRPPVKRSGHVALLVMGTLAVGTSAYTLMPHRTCDPAPAGATAPPAASPGAPQPQASTECRSGSSSSGGSHWSSRSNFFSSDSAGHSSSGTSSESGHSSVSRGGFGAFGHGFSGGG